MGLLDGLPASFPSLKAAAEYVLGVHYRLDALAECGRREKRPLVGTELASVMLADDVLTADERSVIRERERQRVHRENWEHACSVVYD